MQVPQKQSWRCKSLCTGTVFGKRPSGVEVRNGKWDGEGRRANTRMYHELAITTGNGPMDLARSPMKWVSNDWGEHLSVGPSPTDEGSPHEHGPLSILKFHNIWASNRYSRPSIWGVRDTPWQEASVQAQGQMMSSCTWVKLGNSCREAVREAVTGVKVG